MLRHKFFHRAKKVVISEEELNKMRGIKKKATKEDKKTLEKEDSKESKDVKDEKGEEKADEQKEQRKKPKVNMNIHLLGLNINFFLSFFFFVSKATKHMFDFR